MKSMNSGKQMKKPEGRSLRLMHRLFMAEDIKSDQSRLTGLYLGMDGADEIGTSCFDTSLEYFYLYIEALFIVGSVHEKIHKEWLDNAWDIFIRGEFVTDLNLIYDDCFLYEKILLLNTSIFRGDYPGR